MNHQTNDKTNVSLHTWLCLCTLDVLLTYFLGDLLLQPLSVVSKRSKHHHILHFLSNVRKWELARNSHFNPRLAFSRRCSHTVTVLLKLHLESPNARWMLPWFVLWNEQPRRQLVIYILSFSLASKGNCHSVSPAKYTSMSCFWSWLANDSLLWKRNLHLLLVPSSRITLMWSQGHTGN